MNIRQLNKLVTSKTLNETLAKKFGTKIDVDSFTLEQLQDARNKMRTKQFDIETNESFSGLSQNRTYSKNKLFLDVLNAAISERSDIAETQSAAQKAAFQKMLAKKKGAKPAAKDTKDKKPKDGKMPMDDNGTPGDKSDDKPAFLKDDTKKESKVVDEGTDIINNYFASILKEGAEDNAELIMAAKDMVDRLTGWMEDTAEMQTESMLELADAIRDEMGAQQSEAFTNVVKPALEQLYASMESTRIALTGGVGMLTGEGEAPAMDMGAELPAEEPVPGAEDMEPTVDTDEFAAAAPAAGGEAEAGRERRESRNFAKKKMIETSRRLGSILSSAKASR